jgi:hypothetical protein
VDTQRFDLLTRHLAQSHSRREAIKAFAASVLGLGAVSLVGRGALAQDCAGIQEACSTNADCCEGYTCNENYICIALAECATEGQGCAADGQCCGDAICCAGACRSIECCIDEADPNARCPEGTSCFEGVCDPIGSQTACSSDDECGEGEICCAAACRAIECCIDDADPNARCPEGTSCFEGVCDPVGSQTGGSLPNTGTGTGTASPASHTDLLAFGAAAAAAALIGGRAVRKQAASDEP